jgi:RNA polymerase sigma-70 factor (ECF subfamily)
MNPPDLDRLARELLRSQDAEDVAQDAWLLFGGRLPSRVHNATGWLRIVILRLAARSRERARQRARREWIVARRDHAPSVIELLERESQSEFVAALVGELDDPYREVVRLRYLEDLEVEEIAARVGRLPATVRSQLKRGLDNLRLRLGADPGRRRKLGMLFPMALSGTAERSARTMGRLAGRPAMIWCWIGCLLVFGVWIAATRSEREVLVAAVQPIEETPRITPEVRPITRAARNAVVAEVLANEGALERQPRRDICVEGDVLEAGGAPVPGAAILVGTEDGNEAEVVGHSDPSGHYRVEGVDGRDLVWAENRGVVSSSRHLLGSIAPGRRLDLQLGSPLVTLFGHLYSFDGRPVARAEIVSIPVTLSFFPSDEGTLAMVPSPVRASTAADGSFRMDVSSQEKFNLFIAAEGHPPLAMTGRIPEADEEVDITLPRPATLAGRVVRPDGTPAAGARFGLVFPFFPSRETATDESGEFRFDALPPGPYLLRLLEERGPAPPSCFIEGHLRRGERGFQRVTLREEHTLRGRAVDGTSPLAGWWVEIEDIDLRYPRELRRTRTDGDGRFAFPSCSLEDRHVLRLIEPRDDAGLPCAVMSEVRAGRADIVLHADGATARSGCLAGRFESSSGRLRPVLAALRGDAFSEPLLFPVEPDTGAFEVTAQPPGTHRLLGWVPGVGVLDAGTIELRPGQRTEVSVAVPEPGFLRVELAPSERNRGVWSATILTPAFQASTDAFPRRLRESPEENALVAELFPGDYDYKVSYGGMVYEFRHVRIEAGRTTEDTLSLPEVVSLKLRLTFERPLRGGERVTLVIREGARERSIDLGGLPGSWGSHTLSLDLAPDAEEIQVRTSLGLGGRLAVKPTDILPDHLLRLAVGESTER